MRTLVLKVDVDTYRGTLEGVPRLVHCLKRHQTPSTFLFSLGPDRTGRAIKRVFRPGFFSKVSRTSVVEHYGVRTLLYGTLLPAPDISLRCAAQLHETEANGHEVGIHCFDHITWQDGVMAADVPTTERWMRAAQERFKLIFKRQAKIHGAAGWQMNAQAFRLTEQLGFEWSSDTRGEYPFLPIVNGQTIFCPQLPTTLPTFDELLGLNGQTAKHVVDELLHYTQETPLCGHIYTLHAELEGGKLMYYFEQLLEGWKKQGYRFLTLSEFGKLAVHQAGGYLDSLPRHDINFNGQLAGRSGTLCTPGSIYPDIYTHSF
ncbi:MAG: 4-deoxy-4-formamido-L-arabinose-phosphoundecaprenol deformylase [Pseudomonadota bacterium]